MLSWINRRYQDNRKAQLWPSYQIALFERKIDRKMLQALVMILGKKIQIEVDEAMVLIAYNIIEAHICYDFPTFICNEIKRCLFKITKSNFRHSSYLWWLFTHQNLVKLIEGELPI